MNRPEFPLSAIGANDPLPPTLRETWNAIIQAGRNAYEAQIGQNEPNSLPTIIPPSCIILVVNGTGGSLSEFSVLALGTPQIDQTVDPNSARLTPIFNGTVPTSYINPFAITIEPAAAGDTVRAVVLGVIPCNVLMNVASDMYAGPLTSDSSKLTSSGSAGPAIIISVPTGTAPYTARAMVLLCGATAEGAVPDSITFRDTTGTPSYPGINTAQFTKTTGLSVSNPSTGVAQIDLLAASASQMGGVTTTTQTFAGNKTFNGYILDFLNIYVEDSPHSNRGRRVANPSGTGYVSSTYIVEAYAVPNVAPPLSNIGSGAQLSVSTPIGPTEQIGNVTFINAGSTGGTWTSDVMYLYAVTTQFGYSLSGGVPYLTIYPLDSFATGAGFVAPTKFGVGAITDGSLVWGVTGTLAPGMSVAGGIIISAGSGSFATTGANTFTGAQTIHPSTDVVPLTLQDGGAGTSDLLDAKSAGGSTIMSLGSTGALYVNGTAELDGTGQVTFTTPVGNSVSTKILVPVFDPGAFGQIVAMGIPSSSGANARVMLLFDARAGSTPHQPTINILSPDENQAIGFSWEGTNTLGTLKCSQDMGFSVGTLSGDNNVMVLSSGSRTATIDAFQDTSIGLAVFGHTTTQSADIFRVNKSDGTVFFSVGASGSTNANSNNIVNVSDPVNPQDAATKNYVDLGLHGLSPKDSCTCATAAALPTNTYSGGVITVTATGTLTVDGHLTALNDRVLVKNEGIGANNGLYLVTTAGAVGVQAVLTRTTDANTGAEIWGAFTLIEEGTDNQSTLWGNTNSSLPTIGVTAITFGQIGGPGAYIADETTLHLSGVTFSIKSTYIGQTSITTLGTVGTGTWQGVTVATGFGGTGVTSVTTVPTATAFAGWDANKNLSANSMLAGYASTATAAGTTTITVASAQSQFFTGTSTQTLVLPVVATLALGTTYFVNNNSTGAVTVQSSGLNTVQVVAPGSSAWFTSTATSGTGASVWDVAYAPNPLGGVGAGGIAPGIITLYKSGLTLSNDSGTPNTIIDIAAGTARDSTDTYSLYLPSATKKTTGSFVAGNGNGGLDTGTIAASTTYHFYIIAKADGSAVDVLFSTSATAPTMPSTYTLLRRIGSLYTDGSTHWVLFKQDQNYFNLLTPVTDINGVTNPGTSAVTRTLSSIPTGVRFRALISVLGGCGTSADSPGGVYISDLSVTDVAAGIIFDPCYPYISTSASASLYSGAPAEVWTSTVAQVRSRLQFSGTTTLLYITTRGWYDPFVN